VAGSRYVADSQTELNEIKTKLVDALAFVLSYDEMVNELESLQAIPPNKITFLRNNRATVRPVYVNKITKIVAKNIEEHAFGELMEVVRNATQ